MQCNTTRHPKARHATTRRDAIRHRAADHVAAQRNTAQPSRARGNTARTVTTQHVTTQHDAAPRPTAHQNTKQRTLTKGLTKSSHCTPRKEPHQPATHRQGATACPATTVAVHAHKPPPESYNRHRGDERTRLTQGHTQPPGAAAQPAEPEPNPAGRGTEPKVYITHPNHGAGAQPGKTQPPTANRKAIQNANQCVCQSREGRGRNGQTPPQKKNRGGAQEPPTATAPLTNTTRGRQPPHPDGTEDGTRQRGARGPPSQNRQHQAEGSGPPGEGTPKTPEHTPRGKKQQQTTRPGREGIGAQRPRDPRPGQPATDTTKPPKKKPKGRGGGANFTNGTTRTPPGKARYKRGAHTNTHTFQHPSQGWRSAAASQARPHTPAPHPQPGGAGGNAGRADKHTRTLTPA